MSDFKSTQQKISDLEQKVADLTAQIEAIKNPPRNPYSLRAVHSAPKEQERTDPETVRDAYRKYKAR